DGDGNFYFMEVNARIQVEHPVTEMVTGLDLVKEQIRLASGELLGYGQGDIVQTGWSIECRINAENPEMNFVPNPGVIERYVPPAGEGVRLDTHLYQGYELPIYYDSLIAKLISTAPTRDEAIAVMKQALMDFVVAPIKTTIPLYQRIMDDADFQKGKFDTGFIKKFLPDDDDDDDD
ncbi:MAG: acetyl-CoA carboxylase biotin carboxylase subunit, partial [Deltaproteobacteria bacterium]|nr:acetyl-CoA carboxylase biotin carboxylase subunit [Deltaproteobacteria bacterium]